MRVGAVSGDTVVTLAAGLAVGVVALILVRKLQGAAAGISDLPAAAWQAAKDVAAAAGDAVAAAGASVQTGILDARQAVADSNPNNPGYQLPPGWYRVKTRWGEVLTRNPDSFKTLNPYDTLGLIDP